MNEIVIHMVKWILDNKVDAFAIFLAIASLIRSEQNNRNSEKIMRDTSFMIVQQISLLNELKKNIVTYKRKPNVLNLSKDGIRLHKLYGFKKRDIPSIMENINHLVIKGRFKQEIKTFLNSKDVDYKCNFWGEAQSDGEVNITELYEILLRYNVIMIIDYH